MAHEIALSKAVATTLENPAAALWKLMNVDPMPGCMGNFRKHGGACADLSYIDPGKTFLLIENKLNEAPLMPRQEFFYLNHFLAIYARNPNLEVGRNVLVFLIRERGKSYLKKLQRLIEPSYRFPSPLEKSLLRNASILLDGNRIGPSATSFSVRGEYKRLNKEFQLEVRLVELSDSEMGGISGRLAAA